MSVARDDHFLRLICKIDECGHHPSKRKIEFVTSGFKPETHISSHLVVTTTSGVKLCGCGHLLCEGLLNVHVDIFEFGIPRELVRFDLFKDRIETRLDRIALLKSDNTDMGEHSGLRLTALNIEGRQSLIERDGFANTEHQFSGTFGKPSTPSHLFFSI